LCDVLSGIESSDLTMVRQLLRERPYVFHFEIRHGWPILHRCIARRCADLNLVKLFVAQGGDVNRKTDSGVSLAFLAATMPDDQEILKYLISIGGRMSSFEEAVMVLTTELDENHAKATISKLLDKEPLLVNQTGDSGFTLLHHAVYNYRYAIVGVLLERGANVNSVTCSGKSPLGFCGEPKNADGMTCYELLVAKGAHYTSFEQLEKLIRDGEDDEVIKRLELDPRLVNAWFAPPLGPILHVSVWLGTGVKLTDYLVKRQVNLNIPNEQGRRNWS